MTEFFADMPILTLIVKFMVASTVLLGTVWFLEKTKVINTPDLAELAWKLAIAGSFIALLPVGDWISTPITIQDARTSELARQFNEGRPLLSVALPGADAASEKGLPRNNAVPSKDLPDTILPQSETTSAGVSAPSNADSSQKLPDLPPAAPAYQGPVTNSETHIKTEEIQAVDFLEEMATLRTKDFVFLGWAVIAALAALTLTFAYMVAVKALGSRVRVTAEDEANRTLREICEKADIRHVPYLSRSSDLKSPVCLPRREICLPDWAFDDLPKEELRSLLAHEVGHMVRRDPLMLMFLQMLSRLFFFQPLFILARKRLTDLAELAADEWAARQLADARSVAAALYTCATKIHEDRQIQWGLAMAGNKSMLKTRVERLIGADSLPFQQSGRLAKGAVTVGVLAVTLGLPSIQFADALSAGHPQELVLSDWPMVMDQDAPALRQHWEELNRERTVALAQLDTVEQQELIKLKAKLGALGLDKNLKIAEPLKAIESLSVTQVVILDAVAREKTTLAPKEIEKIEALVEEANARAREHTMELSVKVQEIEEQFFTIAQEFEELGEREFLASSEWQAIISETEARRSEAAERVHAHAHKLASANEKFHRESDKEGIHHSIQSRDNSGNMVWSNNGYTVKASWEGEFRISDDDRRIEWVEQGGEVKLQTKGKGAKRSIRIENDGDGKLDVRYQINGKRQNLDKQTLDKDGERWLAKTLLVLLRGTGLNAEERVARMLKKSGPDAVIREMQQIESDYVVRLYSGHLVNQSHLTNRQINKLLTRLQRIDSDYELRLALTNLFQLDSIDSRVMPWVLNAAKTIDSDYELRLLLSPYLARFGVNDGTIKVVLDLAREMDSDYEMRLLLTQAMDDNTIGEKNLEKFVKIATSNIDSDYELRLLLSSVAGQYGRSEKATRLVVNALNEIDGDYERRLLLTMIVDEGAFDRGGWLAVIKAARDIDGDYEKRLALAAIKGRMPRDKKISAAYDAAVKSIDSDYERGLLTADKGKPESRKGDRKRANTLRSQTGAIITAPRRTTAEAIAN